MQVQSGTTRCYSFRLTHWIWVGFHRIQGQLGLHSANFGWWSRPSSNFARPKLRCVRPTLVGCEHSWVKLAIFWLSPTNSEACLGQHRPIFRWCGHQVWSGFDQIWACLGRIRARFGHARADFDQGWAGFEICSLEPGPDRVGGWQHRCRAALPRCSTCGVAHCFSCLWGCATACALWQLCLV